MRTRVLAVFLAAFCIAAARAGGAAPTAAPEDALSLESSAPDILAACRAMLPAKPVEIKGRLTRRNRKGIVSREHSFAIYMDRTAVPAKISAEIVPADGSEPLRVEVSRPDGGCASVEILRADGSRERPEMSGDVPGTDVSWLDLTLDFLWWTDASFEAERTGETVHGQECLVILAKPPSPYGGVGAVRLWVDRKTGCMMQAEQLAADGAGGWKSVRRLWGTRLKKFPGHETVSGVRVETKRWMASAIEVQKTGGIHRTKISIEEIDDEPGPAVREAARR